MIPPRKGQKTVLIACEYSGLVRDAFMRLGWYAVSCDLLPSEGNRNGLHYQGDIFEIIKSRQWGMLIAFPPCTHLCVSGAKWFADKISDGRQQGGIDFFLRLARAPVERIAIENPIGIMSSRYREPDQIVQPWQFGHGETKATCLWLKNLPPLTATNIVDGRVARIHNMAPSKDRSKERSKTYAGIAEAMASQWTNLRGFGTQQELL